MSMCVYVFVRYGRLYCTYNYTLGVHNVLSRLQGVPKVPASVLASTFGKPCERSFVDRVKRVLLVCVVHLLLRPYSIS